MICATCPTVAAPPAEIKRPRPPSEGSPRSVLVVGRHEAVVAVVLHLLVHLLERRLLLGAEQAHQLRHHSLVDRLELLVRGAHGDHLLANRGRVSAAALEQGVDVVVLLARPASRETCCEE